MTVWPDANPRSLNRPAETRGTEVWHRPRIFEAERLAETPDAQDLLLKHASILALDAVYEEASGALMALHRRLPGKPAILRRLVAVFEQIRNAGKAAALLRANQQAVPEDPWATSKAESFREMGLP